MASTLSEKLACCSPIACGWFALISNDYSLCPGEWSRKVDDMAALDAAVASLNQLL
jgi:hypothetical protein